jgi:NAD(P)-dependent dehydrogenase (short-subunit alcohol dehydrogenase family)
MAPQDKQEKEFPPQEQQLPGSQKRMRPEPEVVRPGYKGSGKLEGKVALITGGDSGIGRSVAVYYAHEGADCVIVYLSEHEDAEDTKRMVEELGRRCVLMPGDAGDEQFCKEVVERTIKELGKLDILVNNAAEQHVKESIDEITAEQLERTFRTNIFSYFYLTKAALNHLKEGSCVINCTSVTAYRGSAHLLDYSATKGAIVTFTRSLAQQFAEKKIRVNGVAPGPIWTPLIPATFDAESVETFGADSPLGRAGQPSEVAPSFVFLASDDASYMTGQILHPNGGEIING